jgi:hypothetical protein
VYIRDFSSSFHTSLTLVFVSELENIAVCDLWVLKPSAASGSLYLSKYIRSGRMIQKKITKTVSILEVLCGQSCDRNRVTGMISRVSRCDAVPSRYMD